MVNLKCCEVHELKNDKIVESYILIDLIDLFIDLSARVFLTKCGVFKSFFTSLLNKSLVAVFLSSFLSK